MARLMRLRASAMLNFLNMMRLLSERERRSGQGGCSPLWFRPRPKGFRHAGGALLPFSQRAATAWDASFYGVKFKLENPSTARQ
jgi:hypothetical protein